MLNESKKRTNLPALVEDSLSRHQMTRVVGDDSYCSSFHECKATDNISGIVGHDFEESIIINHLLDNGGPTSASRPSSRCFTFTIL
jgi:hypothetical protein